ncbi:rhomboid family intramembrane serine protease [Mucilaginibacter sp. PPCGB 2223]|uniref:rhomboid family intramembrane serine protease n=1 Tax=Mucilaginibacter sp. PPCGB 2223 TaxID=1886027 RepID=UPI000825C3B7|nr:rhomboid family intramembrane serine protease [Mucilaginibacter sp. PPCGB 2223]OCX52373.1 rhomboid family intramembrane serine protease [Mucilaginibacter sp. PPCGB 2223]
MSQYRPSPFANITPVVKNLLIINFIFYLAEWVLQGHFDMLGTFSAFYFDSPLFRPWQIITYMFMHASKDPMHIIGNMFGLFMFGPMLEYTMGSKRFFNFYFLTGIGALLLQLGIQALELHSITGHFTLGDFQPHDIATALKLEAIYGPILGASGAIFGILAGFALLFPNVEMMMIMIPFPVKAKYFVGFYFLYELYDGISRSGDNIAHFAHVGGAIVGFILIKIWGLRGPRQFY